jgi:hypothetical protein
MLVRLTRRLATYIDGVNLSAHRVGDVFEVTRHEAELLIAEEWAVPVVPRARKLQSRLAASAGRAPAVDRRRALIANQLHDIRTRIQRRTFHAHEHRRAEDRIREAWHDEHARILNAPATSR